MNEDNIELVGLCTDCLTTFNESVLEKDKFITAGANGICKFCGGPIIITTPDNVQNLRNRRKGGGMLD